MKKGKRNGIKRMAEAKEDADEILECYRRIQIRLQRFSVSVTNAPIDTLLKVRSLMRTSAPGLL